MQSFAREQLKVPTCTDLNHINRHFVVTCIYLQLTLPLLDVGFWFLLMIYTLCNIHPQPLIYQMMSVHDERTVSQKILQTLYHIACTAAYHIGECCVTLVKFNVIAGQHGNFSFDFQFKMETSSSKCGSRVWPTWRWC